MRLLKSLAIITLSCFIGLSAHAEEKANKQQAKSQQNTNKQQAKPQQNTNKQSTKSKKLTPEQQLKRFTSSIALRFDGIEVSSKNGQNIINFRYTLQNTSKKSISDVEWITVYYHDNEAILMQNVPVSLKKLEPKKARNLVFSIPFANLSPKAQQVFSNPNSKISSQFQAKSITFTDKSKIVIQ